MSPLDPRQRFKMERSQSKLSDALKRDVCADYYEGYFSVTLHVKEKAPVLGEVVGVAGAAAGSKDAPRIELSELGKAIERKWNEIPNFDPNVTLIEKQVMPEHFHGLLHMKRVEKRHLGRVIGGFMIGCTHAYWDCLGILWHKVPPKVCMQDRDHTRSFRGPSLFERGYNDVEPLTQEELEVKINYIRSNPERRLIKRQCHEYFIVRWDMHSPNWTLQRLQAALLADRGLKRQPEALAQAWQEVMGKVAITDACATNNVLQAVAGKSSRLSLSLAGNRALLTAGKRLLPLVCHRADAPYFEQQKDAMMREVRAGAIIVSAFISPREREIRKELMQESLPLIEVVDNGFSPRYKPCGQAFYACARGLLLQISPWVYKYQRDVRVSRPMCLVMNELVRCICKIPDDWWMAKRAVSGSEDSAGGDDVSGA